MSEISNEHTTLGLFNFSAQHNNREDVKILK
jgi:hypothetical protein